MHKSIQRYSDISAQSVNADAPLLKRVYANRHIQNDNELDYSIHNLLPFTGLKGCEQAAEKITAAIKQQKRIVIVGDFDVDGATSTTVAVKALRSMGAINVEFLVPNRFEFGYGLSPEIVAVAKEQFNADMIITVDNGISSIEGVITANRLGIEVIVTDHHLAGEVLPEAAVIVNPNQPGDGFTSKMLAGVGVIFYVMLALRSYLRQQGWFQQQGLDEPNLANLLDLVALGTVADVVPLDYNNRILVSQGLARIRSGHVSNGIRALIDVAGRDSSRLVASDFAFAIAPRLNAAGRLDDMTLGIQCLLSDNLAYAGQLAQQLDEINHARRDIEADMKQQAEKILAHMQLDDSDLPYGLCLHDRDFHEGVVGIIASRIKDRWHRPVIVFAPAENGQLKGSGRSIKGLHIRDALDAIATRHPGLIKKFGGHAMAAGLSIAEEDYALFSAAFDQEVRQHLSETDLTGIIMSDGELKSEEFNLQTAEELRFAGPWGQAFPEPVFDGIFHIRYKRVVAERHLKLTLQAEGSDTEVDAIAFNSSDADWPASTQKLRLAYRLDVNLFRGNKSLQLMVEHIEPLP